MTAPRTPGNEKVMVPFWDSNRDWERAKSTKSNAAATGASLPCQNRDLFMLAASTCNTGIDPTHKTPNYYATTLFPEKLSFHCRRYVKRNAKTNTLEEEEWPTGCDFKNRRVPSTKNNDHIQLGNNGAVITEKKCYKAIAEIFSPPRQKKTLSDEEIAQEERRDGPLIRHVRTGIVHERSSSLHGLAWSYALQNYLESLLGIPLNVDVSVRLESLINKRKTESWDVWTVVQDFCSDKFSDHVWVNSETEIFVDTEKGANKVDDQVKRQFETTKKLLQVEGKLSPFVYKRLLCGVSVKHLGGGVLETTLPAVDWGDSAQHRTSTVTQHAPKTITKDQKSTFPEGCSFQIKDDHTFQATWNPNFNKMEPKSPDFLGKRGVFPICNNKCKGAWVVKDHAFRSTGKHCVRPEANFQGEITTKCKHMDSQCLRCAEGKYIFRKHLPILFANF